VRTNIDIDDKLLAKAMRLARAKTKREVVHRARMFHQTTPVMLADPHQRTLSR
jgi:Arc/MetJ family transcription regulator